MIGETRLAVQNGNLWAGRCSNRRQAHRPWGTRAVEHARPEPEFKEDRAQYQRPVFGVSSLGESIEREGELHRVDESMLRGARVLEQALQMLAVRHKRLDRTVRDEGFLAPFEDLLRQNMRQ